jgi:hypothetical protein
MKILFVMKHPAAVRSLDSVLQMLDERGNEVHLAFGGIKPEAHRVLQRIADESRALTFGSLPSSGSPGWTRTRIGWGVLAKTLRRGCDFLRYLEPAYSDAPALRARAEARAHPLIRRAASVAHVAGTSGVRALRRMLDDIERCIEPPQHIERFLTDMAPDVLVVTNLARESVQVDYVRAAKRLGIHTCYPVFSWDNLTNKGLIHELPERVLVWNELQADEAVELHEVPRERVDVLGAWSYDHWFEWEPSRSRAEFCREVGLRADRPIVLYVCSSSFVAPGEVAFVRRWIGELRRRDGALAEAGILVRPHPRNAAPWGGVSLHDQQSVVWPQHGEEPLEAESRRNYFDSIYHAAAVVGINTSAQIESAIVGRPVHTILADEFRGTQQGTLHFRYLQADDFGHLYVGRTMEEHGEQLAASLEGQVDEGRNERFVRRFVRPLGLDVSASPLYAQTLEELAKRPANSRDRGPALAPLARIALSPIAAAALRRIERRPRPAQQTDGIRDIRRRIRGAEGARVIAAPWLGSETAELLYWIPFLRWIQTATFGLRDRLVVVARESSLPWYAGIGAQQFSAADFLSVGELASNGGSIHKAEADGAKRLAHQLDVDDAILVLPSAVIAERERLVSNPQASFQRRRLEFAPLTAPEASGSLEVPDEFVAVRFDSDQAELASALADRSAVVAIDGLDPAGKASMIARARGFVGCYGPDAVVAVLLGRPAVVLAGEGIDPHELGVAAAFLAGEPYGRLQVVEPVGSAREAAAWLLQALDAPAEAFAVV